MLTGSSKQEPNLGCNYLGGRRYTLAKVAGMLAATLDPAFRFDFTSKSGRNLCKGEKSPVQREKGERMRKYVIIGGGVAGITAAQEIVKADGGADVHLISAEPRPYYRRPLLWKFIAGEIEESALYFRPAEWYQERHIHLHLGALVTALAAQEHLLTLADGDRIFYDRLLLATGGRPFLPPIQGADRQGVFTLRTFEDAQAIKAYASQSHNVVVIGGGLLGLETARALLTPKTRVSVLEFMPHLLPRQLCAIGAGVLQVQLEKMGLNILTAAVTDEILGNSRVSGVRLKDGRVIESEMVVVSAGIRSRTDLAQDGGIEANRGIVVDQQLRTSATDVYAAGDSAEFEGVVYGIIPAATEQARIAAANMVAHGSAIYKGTVPSTTLKVVGIDLACLGNSTAIEDGGFTVLGRKDESAGVFKKLVLQDGKITGAVLMGDTGDVRPLQQLIEKRVDVSASRDRLLDADFDLWELARG